MISVKADLTSIDIKGPLTQFLAKQLEDMFKRALRSGIQAAFKRIPVDIGQAASSLLPAGRFLRAGLTVSNYREPRKAERKPRPHYPFGRTRTAGVRQGSYDYQATPGLQYRFAIKSTVFHFALLDTGFQNANSPWGAIEAFRAEVVRFLRIEKRKIPRLIRSRVRTKRLRS